MKLTPVFTGYLFFLGSWLLVLVPAHAASLYVDPGLSTLNRGDSVTMSVRLDVDEAAEECVNAVDGVLNYSTNIEPVDISVGDSIFNIWVEQPKINKEDRTITFAGGIPNGYCGRVVGDPRLTNVLTRIVFRSPGFSVGSSEENKGTAFVSFSDESTAYLNDGQGTKANLTTYGAEIELSDRPGATALNPWRDEVGEDKIPPEKFAITLVKGDGNFSNKYYIVFNTSDKQTGVDHYEVIEEPLSQFGSFQWGRADAPWSEERSPYTLSDQSLNSIIRVKAIDKAGNEYIATLIPDESVRTISQSNIINGVLIAGVFLLLFISVLFGYRFYVKKRQRTNINLDSSHENEQL